MKKLLTLLLFISLASCASTNGKRSVIWVGGIKVECLIGTDRSECLLVNKNEFSDQGGWEVLNAAIEGFEFEKGFLKQIEVLEIDSNKPTDSGKTYQKEYVLIREIEKLRDTRILLDGDWKLETLDGRELLIEDSLPVLTIRLSEMRIYGNDGCNEYFGTLSELTGDEITIDNVGATRKMCQNMGIPDRYQEVLNRVATYKIAPQSLIFFDPEGKEILKFVKMN